MASLRCPQLLLGLPRDVLASRIAGLLTPADRLSLCHTCRDLWASSYSGWFPEVRVALRSETNAEALGAWLRRTGGKVHISCIEGRHPLKGPFSKEAVRAALDTLRDAVAAIHSSGISIPASTLSHHPSLTRLVFDGCSMPPLRDLAAHTQLHGLRELVCKVGQPGPFRRLQLQHAAPLTQLEILDIDRMQTTRAGSTLAALPQLRELSLGQSDLRAVPARMAGLTRLTRLVLRLTQMKDGWQHLPLQLKLLDISWIGLDAVPPELPRLSRLTELDLAGNAKIEGLEVLSRLGCLRKVDMHECGLGDAGLVVALLRSLQWLDLADNELTAVPAALAQLTGLTELELSDIELAGGWQHLAGMQQLASLSLWSCINLVAVPAEFLQLTALTYLDLHDTSIADGWQHLASMQRLAKLTTCGISLTAVPQVFSQLTALTRLDMYRNAHISSGLQHLASMQQLESLSIGWGRIPQELLHLTALTHLHLSEKHIASGWKHLASMPQLADLEVEHCGLTAVPQVFSQLTALIRLDMNRNPHISSGWQHLAGMQQLAHLSANDCGLAAVPPVFSQLTSLTSLNLRHNPIVSGWQHLSLLALHDLKTDPSPAH